MYEEQNKLINDCKLKLIENVVKLEATNINQLIFQVMAIRSILKIKLIKNVVDNKS